MLIGIRNPNKNNSTWWIVVTFKPAKDFLKTDMLPNQTLFVQHLSDKSSSVLYRKPFPNLKTKKQDKKEKM